MYIFAHVHRRSTDDPEEIARKLRESIQESNPGMNPDDVVINTGGKGRNPRADRSAHDEKMKKKHAEFEERRRRHKAKKEDSGNEL